jgi:hypothetical protein
MDILSPQQASSPPTQPKGRHWPDTPAERGMVYGVNDPIHTGARLVVMLNDTWLDYGTQAAQMKKQLDDSIAAGRKLKVAYDTAIAELASLRDKHENLKRSVKRQRKAAMGFTGSNA